MWSRIILATIAVLVVLSGLDYILHQMLLSDIYGETKELWRPMEEMKMGVMYLSSLISVFFYVTIYAKLIKNKSVKTGLIFGLLLGIGIGSGMGYGTYSYMPIPYALAAGWFWGAIVEMSIAGLIMGLIIKEPQE